jgi:hypothetical protein
MEEEERVIEHLWCFHSREKNAPLGGIFHLPSSLTDYSFVSISWNNF